MCILNSFLNLLPGISIVLLGVSVVLLAINNIVEGRKIRSLERELKSTRELSEQNNEGILYLLSKVSPKDYLKNLEKFTFGRSLSDGESESENANNKGESAND